MKVPTYSKFGLKKYEVEKSEEDESKASRLFSHTLPLLCGGLLGIVVFLVYFISSGQSGFFTMIYQFFLFGTIGIMCVGIPMGVFILAEKGYIYYKKKNNKKYGIIQEFKKERTEYDFWKIRTDDAFWRMLDGLSIEREILNIFMHNGYELLPEFESAEGEYTHVMTKDSSKIYIDFKTNSRLENRETADKLIADMKSAGAEKLYIFCKQGYTNTFADYVKDKPVELLTIRDLIKLIKEIGKKRQEEL